MRGNAFTIERVASRQNPRLKDLRQRLADRGPEDGWLAIEGENLLQEAARSQLAIRTLFLREGHSWLENGAPFSADAVLAVPGEVFASVCGTQAPQGVAAIVRQPQWPLDALLAGIAPRLIVLDGIQDPGNAGTIVRTAEAFGATGVLLLPPAVGPWRQKVLRASAGSIFRLPVVPLAGPQALRVLQDRGIRIYGCAAHEGASIAQAAIGERWAMVIGSEGSGLSKPVTALCDSMLHIPCPGPVESLNAATAAAILLYAASHQGAEK